jgi:hypothetical protein
MTAVEWLFEMCTSGVLCGEMAMVEGGEKDKSGKGENTCERANSSSGEYEGILQKTSHYQITLPYYYRSNGCYFYQYRLTDKQNPISVYDLREVKSLERKGDLDLSIQFHQYYQLELHSSSSSDCQTLSQTIEQFRGNYQKLEPVSSASAALAFNKFTYFMKLEIYDQVLVSSSSLPLSVAMQ